MRIVQIATGWRFGSSNSRSLRSRLHHGERKKPRARWLLTARGKMSRLFGRSTYLEIVTWGNDLCCCSIRQMIDCRYKGTHKALTNYRLSWRLLYEIRTRPSGPTKSFKSYGLTSKERVNGIRFSPPLVTILIENDNSAWNKKREEIF